MELEHQFTVPASIEVTWAAFNDPGRVAPCFPGATLISVDGDEFTGSAKVKLGPIALQYNGTGRYVERDESAHRAVIEAKGKDKRGNGTANATVTAELSAAGDATSVHVTTDLAVTGKPAQFGRGVMQDVSDKLLEQFVTCLQATLGEDAPVSASDTHAVPPAQLAQTAQPTQPGPAAQPGPSAQSVPPGGGAARVPAAAAYRPPLHAAPAADVELNLLRTIGGVLLTRYAARALGPLAFIVGYWLGRRSRR
ncbi:MAG: SRPBCC family protein [Actinomycetota bacterium]